MSSCERIPKGLISGPGDFSKRGHLTKLPSRRRFIPGRGWNAASVMPSSIAARGIKRRSSRSAAKTNVLTYAFDLWERVFNEVAKEYKEIATDYAHVDATCMWMVKNPEWFDVIVTDNMFGDIITDLAAMTQGGLGIAAGGNINPEGVSMFEPMGGSAPKYTGKGVVSPLAAISACQLMLEVLGEEKAAGEVEKAIMKVVNQDVKSLTAGKMGYSTSEVGDLVVKYILGK